MKPSEKTLEASPSDPKEVQAIQDFWSREMENVEREMNGLREKVSHTRFRLISRRLTARASRLPHSRLPSPLQTPQLARSSTSVSIDSVSDGPLVQTLRARIDEMRREADVLRAELATSRGEIIKVRVGAIGTAVDWSSIGRGHSPAVDGRIVVDVECN